jgi:hypothetical protein
MRAIRYMQAWNDFLGPIPAFGVVEPSGVSAGQFTGIAVSRPIHDDSPQAYIVGPSGSATTGNPLGVSNDYPLPALYEASDGTPAPGERWGAKNGTFKLRKGYEGFLIIGGVDATRGTVVVERDPSCPQSSPGSPYYYGHCWGCPQGVPAVYGLTTSGFHDGDCTDCTVFNVTDFPLYNERYVWGIDPDLPGNSRYSGCLFMSPLMATLAHCPPGPLSPAPCGGNYGVILDLTILSLFIIYSGVGSCGWTYTFDWQHKTWDCFGTNVLDLAPPNFVTSCVNPVTVSVRALTGPVGPGV